MFKLLMFRQIIIVIVCRKIDIRVENITLIVYKEN